MLANVGNLFRCPSDNGKTMTNKLATITDNNISYDYVRTLNITVDNLDSPLCFDRGVQLEIDDQFLNRLAYGQTWIYTIAPHQNDGGNILFMDLHASFHTEFPRVGLNSHRLVVPD